MKNPILNGTLIALTAASLFAGACSKKEDTGSKAAPTSDKAPAAPEKMAKIHCQGANECKGKGSCKSEKNACKGQNGCKGQGFVETASADECTTKGGSAVEMKM